MNQNHSFKRKEMPAFILGYFKWLHNDECCIILLKTLEVNLSIVFKETRNMRMLQWSKER